jgi:hypothetical protein
MDEAHLHRGYGPCMTVAAEAAWRDPAVSLVRLADESELAFNQLNSKPSINGAPTVVRRAAAAIA